ncbi:hypothetical protein AAVH_26396, partial [Aphelenchoides avenae]
HCLPQAVTQRSSTFDRLFPGILYQGEFRELSNFSVSRTTLRQRPAGVSYGDASLAWTLLRLTRCCTHGNPASRRTCAYTRGRYTQTKTFELTCQSRRLWRLLVDWEPNAL